MSSILGELRRRNVFRVAGVYAVVGWVLTQIATTLEEAMQLPSWFDGVTVAALLVGFPIALVFAWAFELTPDGVVRTEAVPEGQSITDATGRRLDYAIITGLLLLVVMSVWRMDDPAPVAVETPAVVDAAPEQPAEPEINAASIAVLPFADLSPARDQEYFSDGIAEEILNVLVRTDGLEVTSRTSAFQFKGATLGIPEIAKALRVRHVLEGSVRKSGETIRVTAQLIDADNDKHLWSETFDRPLTAENIFAIQDEIAEAIVVALNAELGLDNLEHIDILPVTENVDAYELFLKARPMFLARRRLDEVDELLARATEKDPEFARAWEMRAAVQTLAVEYGFSDVAVDEAERRGDEFAQRALDIDPNSALALAVRGKDAGNAAETLRRKVDLGNVLGQLSHALQIDPRNGSALNWRGRLYDLVGELENGLADFERCVEFEPHYVPCIVNRAMTLAALGRDEEAMQVMQHALDSGDWLSGFLSLSLLARMDEELAFKLQTARPDVLSGWRRHDELWNAYRHPERDHGELVDSIRAFLEGTGRQTVNGVPVLQWAALPFNDHWSTVNPTMVWDPSLQSYRRSAAFKNFIRKSGVYDYWQAVGFPPQCRPVGADDFECD
jgi:TolB-like protein